MAYSEPTAQFPTALVTAADLLKPENDATSTTLLQNITSGSPAAGGKLYVNDNANFSTNGGVALIDSTTELIGYSATGSDGTGDYLTVDQRAYPGGAAASAASSGDTVKDVVSAEHFKRVHVELIATQTYLGTNASQTAPIANSVLAGTSAGVSSWDTTPTVAGLTINGASGNTLVVDTSTLVVDATNGRVGIGTAGPAQKLEVAGAIQVVTNPTAQLRLRSSKGLVSAGDTIGKLSFYTDDTSNPSTPALAAEIQTVAQNAGTRWEMAFLTGLSDASGPPEEQMRITYGGFVGINKTSPGAQLHVVSSAAGTHIAVFEAAATPSANLIEVNSNGATGGDLLVVDKDGQVGIGTTGPDDQLTIQAADHYPGITFKTGDGVTRGKVHWNNTGNQMIIESASTGHVVTIQPSGGNVGIGTSTFDGTAAGVLAIANGTAPAAGTANQSYIYAKDVSASSEMHVMDEAGNETQISPHDPETGEWVFYSKNTRTGKVLRVQMERLVKFLNSEFGTDFIQEFVEAV